MLLAILKTMRPRQWVKNGLLFVGLFFDRQLTNLPGVLRVFAGFALFSLIASTIYIINDVFDAEEDRQHPKKRFRPLASGELSERTAWVTVVALALISFPLAYLLSPNFFAIVLVYFVLNLSYSVWIKHIPLLDVLALASYYVLRVSAGVTIIQVQRFSPWLYLFTTFMALYLGLGKRRAELVGLLNTPIKTRRVLDGYTLPFLDQLINIVLTCTIITYSLYTFSAPNLPGNHIMMLTIPFVIYGIFRYLYLVQVEELGEAPEEILFSDRPLQGAIFLWGIAILGIYYFL
jgi:4-hydroxybenzoate polyprenyltransferase